MAELRDRASKIERRLARKRKEVELGQINDKNEQYRVTGEFRHGTELAEGEFRALQQAIEEFYQALGFDVATVNDTTSMLTQIENTMIGVSERLSIVFAANPRRVQDHAKEKESERRNKEREVKNQKARGETEEKMRRALEQATKPIKRRIGRVLVQRTIPKSTETRETREEALRQKLEQHAADEHLLFGETWD